MTKKTKNPRNAGRKKSKDPSILIGLRIPPDLIKLIDKRGKNRSKIIIEALRLYLY